MHNDNVCNFGLDARVRRCAFALQEQKLSAKLSAGDLVALEACYHSSCIASLYKRAETVCKGEADDTKFQLEGIALAELITYVEEARAASVSITVFNLADLANMYSTRIEQMGADMKVRVHTTRLRERLLSHVPELEAYKTGCDSFFLGFKKDLALALNKVFRDDCDDEAIHLTKTASIIQRDMLQSMQNVHLMVPSKIFVVPLTKAYMSYKEGLESEAEVVSFSAWCLKKVTAVPQFHFWYLTFQLELLLLVFVRSLREANFELYIDAVSKIVPWVFGLDNTNSARWLPIHLRDMCRLNDVVPDVASQFKRGRFVVNKTSRNFSSIPIGHAHEQNNALVKGEGGAGGLTENPRALRWWMVSGPDMARIINEFENSIATGSTQTKQSAKHHKDTRSLQSLFYRDVTALTRTIEEMGNPFMEEAEDLLVLDTKEKSGLGCIGKTAQG